MARATRPTGVLCFEQGSGGLSQAALGDQGDEEAALVRRSQAGDRAAFEQVVRCTARLVYARAYLETGDRHHSEDVVQETFLVAWKRINQVTEPAGFRTWLLTVTRTVAADARRRESRKKRWGSRHAQPTEFASEVPDGLPGPAESAERREQRERMLELLRKLPEEYGLPLTLRYIAGADYDTIGKQLGLSNGSLRGFLSRGMEKLREMMND
jgi:RNA polymerase sigma-70 factor (ECF subfamily)